MDGRLALDTNVVIALLNHEQDVVGFVGKFREVFVRIIVPGELYFGAYKSGRVQSNLDRIEEFVVTRPVIDCDKDTSNVYGEIKSQLVKSGQPIPDNDIWIAAIAIQFDAVLASQDRHFDKIDELTVVAPPSAG